MHTPRSTLLSFSVFTAFSLITLSALYHLHYTLPYILLGSCQISSRCYDCAVWKPSRKPWDSFATLERNLVQPPCGNPTCLKNLEETHAPAGDWEVGFWVSGVLDSTRIFLWKHNQIELLLCVSYISCEKRRCSRDPISVFSSAAAILYVVPVNYIQYERARLSLMDPKQSKRKHWYIVRSHTRAHTHIYARRK